MGHGVKTLARSASRGLPDRLGPGLAKPVEAPELSLKAARSGRGGRTRQDWSRSYGSYDQPPSPGAGPAGTSDRMPREPVLSAQAKDLMRPSR
jgi:hypothetical protein